jgi:hypothetical protein
MLSVAVVAAFGTGASAAKQIKPSAVHHGAATLARVHPDANKNLYNQNNNDAGVGIVSQNFETAFDAYDNQGADNFKLKAKSTIKQVIVTGVYFNCTTPPCGPADSVTVTVYKNTAGAPGAVVKKFANRPYTDPSTTGSFIVNLGTGKTLAKGTYWVSVQANMDFGSNGNEWAWETRTVQSGAPAMWKNPGDGFGTGCTTYTVVTTCIPSGEGPDFMFQVKGTTP